MTARRQLSFTQTFWAFMVIVTSATIVVGGAVWTWYEISDFRTESEHMRQRYVDNQKVVIRAEVERVVDHIAFRKSQTEAELRQSLEERVAEAESIATHQWEVYRGKTSRSQIESMIIEALRPIRFTHGRGYFFITTTTGIERLYPVAPKYENVDLSDLQDAHGNYVIRDEIELVKRQGAGFITDYWRKPDAGDDMVYPKITYVKALKPFDWYVGTGEYLDDFEADVQDQVLEHIARIRFGDEGYIFVNTYDGRALITDGQRVKEVRNLWDIVDPNGIKVIQEERKAVDNPQGGFISYTWNKLTVAEPAPKISFVKGFPEWQWMIGAGVYTDEIDEIIGNRRAELWADLRAQMIRTAAILVVLLVAASMVARMVAKKIEHSLVAFTEFFERASSESTSITPDVHHFAEFQHLALAANRMIEDRRRIESERAGLREQLARARKMEALGLLAGGVAHDLNNILSGIVSYPDVLLLKLPTDSPLRKPVEVIREAGLRAAAVVSDLVTVSRGTASATAVIDLNELVRELLASPECQELGRAHPSIRVSAELDSELWRLRCSPVHLRKSLLNLIANAAEAVDGPGSVVIATYNRRTARVIRGFEQIPPGSYVVLSVSDSGAGIASHDLPRIFEPFYTRKVLGRSGSGLGLTVVWNTVKDHEGFVDIITSPEGTRFELYLLMTKDPLTSKKTVAPVESYMGHGETILVVDDEERQREIASAILERLGYKVVAVSSGESALEYLAGDEADLVVLDMVMSPGMNGRETFERMLDLRPDQKAIIASGFSETDEISVAQRRGAGGFVRKPYTIEELGVAIRSELDGRPPRGVEQDEPQPPLTPQD